MRHRIKTAVTAAIALVVLIVAIYMGFDWTES